MQIACYVNLLDELINCYHGTCIISVPYNSNVLILCVNCKVGKETCLFNTNLHKVTLLLCHGKTGRKRRINKKKKRRNRKREKEKCLKFHYYLDSSFFLFWELCCATVFVQQSARIFPRVFKIWTACKNHRQFTEPKDAVFKNFSNFYPWTFDLNARTR